VKHKSTLVWSLTVGLIALALGLGGAATAWGQVAPANAAEAGAAVKAPGPGGQTQDQAEVSALQLFAKGGWFMIPILAASFMGLTIIIERLLALRRRKIVPAGFLDGLKAAFRQGTDNISAGIDYCRKNDSPMARVLSAGLHKLDTDEAAVEEAIEDVGANEVSKLRRNLRLLFGVAAVSPMLGLLGSVSGMIRSFQVASIMGVGKAELLSKGIYEALVSTYGGLLVAIPTLIFYYYFLNRIDGIVTEMNDTSRDFLEHYHVKSPAKEA